MEMTQAELRAFLKGRIKSRVLEYLDLVAAAMRLASDENINAVEAFEAACPGVVDAAYTMGQRGELSND